MELDAQLETRKLAFYSKLTLKSKQSVTGRPGTVGPLQSLPRPREVGRTAVLRNHLGIHSSEEC